MRLKEKQDGMSEGELQAATRLEPKQVGRALEELVRGEIVRFDEAARTYHYAPRTDADRAAIESLMTLYHQRPVTLVKLIYAMPSLAITSFADAFRLREDKS